MIGLLRKVIQSKSFILIAPCTIYMNIWAIFPLAYGFYISLHKWDIPFTFQFNWGWNYLRLLSDVIFIKSVILSIAFSFSVVSIELILGLIVALFLNREGKIIRVFTAIHIIPISMAPVMVSMLWRYLYNPHVSPLNYFLSILGLSTRDFAWLGTESMAFLSLMIVDIWEWTPFVTVILLGGLYSLPTSVYESSKIDGASNLQILWHITLPLLKPTLIIAFFIRSIEAFKLFEPIYILTRGGPGTATEFLSFHVYRFGLGQYMRVGDGAAMSYFFLLIVIIYTMFVLKRLRKGRLVYL